MNMVKVWLVIISMFFVFNATSKGWTDLGKITKVVIEHRDGESDIYIKLSSTISTTCPRKDYLAIVADSNEKLARLYSTVLSARVANSDVSFYASDDCNAEGFSKTQMISL